MVGEEAIDESVLLFARQYLQLLDVKSISWPPGSILKEWTIQGWLFEKLFNPQTVSHLPSDRYRLRVLKHLLDLVEKSITDPEEDEISDDLMTQLSTLLSANLPSEAEAVQDEVYVTYNFSPPGTPIASLKSSPVTILESRNVIAAQGTTGLRTWEAALHLGSFLSSASGQAFIKDKTILELGAGTGLISILAAKYLGARKVVATDGVEIIVDAIRTNAFVNGLDAKESLEASALTWGHPVFEESFEEDYGVKGLDLVLGADVTYDKTVVQRLASTIWQLTLFKPRLQVLIAATVRNEATLESFIAACNRSKLVVSDIDFPVPDASSQRGPFYDTSIPIRILHIRLPAAEESV